MSQTCVWLKNSVTFSFSQPGIASATDQRIRQDANISAGCCEEYSILDLRQPAEFVARRACTRKFPALYAIFAHFYFEGSEYFANHQPVST